MNKCKGFSRIWFLGLLLVAFVAGCANNGGESAKDALNNVTSMGLILSPEVASIPVTGNQQYTLLEIFSDGTSQPRTTDINTVWTTLNNNAGNVDLVLSGPTAGLATGDIVTPAGTPVTISATYNGTTVTAALTVNAATSMNFEVIPSDATIAINGGGQQFAAIETFSDGTTYDRNLITERPPLSTCTWTAVDLTGTGVATIGSTTGFATGAAIGTSTITATYIDGAVTQSDSAILTVTAPNPGIAGAAPDLGLAETYGIIAYAAITSSSALSHIYGDVATTTATSSSVTGPNFNDGAEALPNKTSSGVTNSNGVSPGIIDSSDNGNSASLPQLQTDLNAAYLDLSTRAATTTYPAGSYELSGKIILPGVHRIGTMVPADTFALSVDFGPLVLDAQGNPDAVFVLQAGTIVTTTGSVVLQGGAKAKNVFWVVFSDATIGNGASTFFQGTVVAGNTITVGLNTNVQGRMLAGALGAGSITNSGVITVPK